MGTFFQYIVPPDKTYFRESGNRGERKNYRAPDNYFPVFYNYLFESSKKLGHFLIIAITGKFIRFPSFSSFWDDIYPSF